MARRVVSPDGRTWTVRRRWFHVPRWRAPEVSASDVMDSTVLFDFADSLAALALGIALTVLVVALLVYGLPVVIFLAAVAAGIGGLALRVLAIRPWTIEAVADDERLEWHARGWRRSGRVLAEAAGALELGRTDVQPEEAIHALRSRGV